MTNDVSTNNPPLVSGKLAKYFNWKIVRNDLISKKKLCRRGRTHKDSCQASFVCQLKIDLFSKRLSLLDRGRESPNLLNRHLPDRECRSGSKQKPGVTQDVARQENKAKHVISREMLEDIHWIQDKMGKGRTEELIGIWN